MVLFVALALLLALTVGTLSAAQTTMLELRMARNGFDAALAFHAAEAALLEAETWLQASPGDPSSSFTASGAGGLYSAAGYGEVEPWRRADAWSDSNSRAVAEALPGVAAQPRHVVEWVASFVDAGSIDRPAPPEIIDVFRITARGVGAANATALLQSTYGRARGGTRRPMTGRLSWTDLGF